MVHGNAKRPNKEEILDKADYFYYHESIIPISIFRYYELKDVIEEFIGFPASIEISHFPTEYDYKTQTSMGSFNDYVTPITEICELHDDNLLHIHFNKNGKIDNEPHIEQYVKAKRLDDLSWFTPLTIHKVNEVIAKIVDLFTWCCRELADGKLSAFAYDVVYKYPYVSALCRHYGIYDLIHDLFFTGKLQYFKYVKHPNDIDTLYDKLNALKEFIGNYKQYKKKHSMHMEMYIDGIGKFNITDSDGYDVMLYREPNKSSL